MRIIQSSFGVLFLCLSLPVVGQTVPPALIQKVEPNFDLEGKRFFFDQAAISIVVDLQGKPYSLESMTSLPDSVVQALSMWRFRPGTANGKAAAFAITASLPIRRPLDQLPFLINRPAVSDTGTWQYAMWDGLKLNAESAAKLRKKLKDDQSSSRARASLLMFTAKGNDAETRKLHIEQLEWFVRNQPGLGLLGTPASMVFPSSGSPEDAEGYARIKALWLSRLSEKPDDALTLGHATYFLRLNDPELAEKLIVAAMPKVGYAAAWLGELYGLSALGVKSLDPVSGFPSDVNSTLPVSDNGAKSRSLLRSSNDSRVVLSALATVTRAGQALSKGGKLPEGYAAFCQELLAHAKTLYPEATDSCDMPPGHSGAEIERARVIKQVVPVYPPEAKSQGLQGHVDFRAVIGKDGKIKFLELVSGPIALYASAREAVLKWEYRPTMVGGEPAEVTTEIDINYTLERR